MKRFAEELGRSDDLGFLGFPRRSKSDESRRSLSENSIVAWSISPGHNVVRVLIRSHSLHDLAVEMPVRMYEDRQHERQAKERK